MHSIEFEPPKMRRVAVVMLGSMLWGVSLCAAQGTQEAPSPDANGPPTMLADQMARFAAASVAQTPGQPSWIVERRACEGCPPRSVGRALFQTTVVNVFYGVANLARGQVTARVTPKTWWANMEQGWVWDLDDFTVNQIGHPYQGNNYFNTGRANGLSFYESAAVTAFGSGTWEYFGETNHASLNDFINTTLGGIALGEMFHRTAWLVRDTRATGRGRLWREIGATALDPITGVNRFMRGDASRVTDKPADMVPSNLTAFGAAGVLWRGTQDNAFTADGTAIPGGGRGLRGSGQGTQPNTLRRIRDEVTLRRRIGLERSPGARAAARTALQGRQAPVQCRAELRLPEKRRLRHRIPNLRGRIRVHTEPVVHDQVLDAGLGRPDRPRRHRFAPARPDRTPGGGGVRRRGSGRFRGAALLRLRTWIGLWRDRHLLAEQSPVRDALLRGPSPLLPRRRAREPLPAARTRRPPAATARRVRRGRHRRVLRSTDVLPGRRRARASRYHYPQVRAYFTWRLS